ncbi:MAG: GNAT family N-acetyltransferase [Acidimicrobiales bacterium]
MIVDMDGLMTIGEFSDRCGLSAKVLRAYAEVGVLAPAAVDPSSGYRYYVASQLAQAEIVGLLRRAGVAVADIGRFLVAPSPGALDGWERSLAVEFHMRREALADARCRLDVSAVRTRGATMIEIRPVRDRSELADVFDLLGAQLPAPIDRADWHRLGDLDARFAADQELMVVASAEGAPVGGALAFRTDDGWATIRMVGVADALRHRGVGRRLVEWVEAQARRLGVEAVGVGTDGAVGFWFHLGYTPNLLLQWAYDADLHDQESEAVLGGPLAGMHYWRSSFNDVPQLFAELDEPRLDLLSSLQRMVRGCHVGFMMSKKLGYR